MAVVLLCVSSPLQLDGVFTSQAGGTVTQFCAGLAAGADLLLVVRLDAALYCSHQALHRQVTHAGGSYTTQEHGRVIMGFGVNQKIHTEKHLMDSTSSSALVSVTSQGNDTDHALGFNLNLSLSLP